MRHLFVLLISGYQRFISPLFPPSCRYYPSCSEYARVAFERHGVLKGGSLACWRIVRCGPWSKGGIDEVPASDCHCGRHHSG